MSLPKHNRFLFEAPEISIILHIIRKPNSIIVLLFIQNNSYSLNTGGPNSRYEGDAPVSRYRRPLEI